MKVSTHKNQSLLRFIALCVILLSYFAYLSYRYDIVTGGVASILTWSFFVLCTPIADAGFMLDFPLRLLFGIRMVISEIFVWIIAIILNFICFFHYPSYYEIATINRVLYQILSSPFPYWLIILISAAGTFLSIKFGDELMDSIHHKNKSFLHSHHFKHEVILIIFFILAVLGYYELIKSLDIDIR